MRAIVIEQFGDAKNLQFKELPIPVPEEREVQIKILYTSVNPVDWKIREGMLQGRLPHEFPIIPGWDAAGIVTALGSKVSQFQVGDQVYTYSRKPVVHSGTYAEYICFDAEHVALKPKNLSFAQAAAIPLVGLTAWQALFDFGKLKRGETILIHAGAGGVGSVAIGLAKNAGAKVYTTASEQNHAYVKKLGADVAIDYRKESFKDRMKQLEPQGIDLVLECIGGDVMKQSVEVVKEGGRIISILGQLNPRMAQEKNISFHYVFVSPNGEELKQLTALFEQGKLELPNIEEMGLDEAATAQEKVRQGHTRGKIVLKVG